MRHRGQALVELALVTPLVALLALGLFGVSRLQLLRMEVDAVARETARAAVVEPLPASPAETTAAEETAARNAADVGAQVAAGYGLDIQPRVTFVQPFARGSLVRGHAELSVRVGELLALSGFAQNASPNLTLSSDDVERVDLHRGLGS